MLWNSSDRMRFYQSCHAEDGVLGNLDWLDNAMHKFCQIFLFFWMVSPYVILYLKDDYVKDILCLFYLYSLHGYMSSLSLFIIFIICQGYTLSPLSLFFIFSRNLILSRNQVKKERCLHLIKALNWLLEMGVW